MTHFANIESYTTASHTWSKSVSPRLSARKETGGHPSSSLLLLRHRSRVSIIIIMTTNTNETPANPEVKKKKVKKTIVTPAEIETALCVLQGVLCNGT